MKKEIVLLSATVLALNLNAFNLDDITNKAIGSAFSSLDKQFNGLLKQGTNLVNQCYDTSSFRFNTNLDICELASEIDKLNVNVCSLIGGSGTKKVGITGAKYLCNSKAREFSDYASKQAGDFAEWKILDEEESNELKASLPSGQKVKEYFGNWDISNVLKTDKGIVSSYLKDGNMKAVGVIMEYAKTSGANTDLTKIKIEDIKAPANLEAYNKGVSESVKTYKSAIKEANPNQVSNSVKATLSEASQSELSKKANEHVSKAKSNFDVAKQIEISNALAISNHKEIAIPTDEYVQTMRKDLRPLLVAQIRKQQAIETSIISAIEEKYANKYEIAKLLADKEVIMALQFDEASAKAEIDQIANSASSGGNSIGKFIK
ncbi:hypothetical protein [Campylobacter sp. RM16187]|uniref:hypothetical protein n=1 Tax=Campylobacter sp. RM16187 TaxID=1660063 RepID=UPI0021B5A69C|nr:hypothetical protein [Campylobacter sp. RM16187]QKG30263.1 hypothetical protein CDOMF_a014 [Campylobacter sp. RM16187]